MVVLPEVKYILYPDESREQPRYVMWISTTHEKNSNSCYLVGENYTMIELWKCKDCNRVNFSIPERHHELDTCECGKNWVDLETYGCRATIGVDFINKLNFNPFLEIITCMDEQGFEPYVKIDKLYLNLAAVLKARELENKIIKDIIDDKYNNTNS